MMSDLPEHIRAEVISELYRQAANLDWELLPLSQKKIQYRKWVEDPRVGGRLRSFLDDHRIGTWIKDTPMKEYARAQEGFGSLAAYAASRYSPSPEHLIREALGANWAIRPRSLDEKPMHCIAASGSQRRYVCWGRPGTFRDLAWAALNEAISAPIRPMIIVTLHDGVITSTNEQKLQRSIAEHCGIDICYVNRHVQMVAR
jgi:hypothetical protein